MNFVEEVKKLGIDLNSEQLEKFDLFYKELIAVNQYMNLTAIIDKEEVYRKHFLDSLELFPLLTETKEYTLCDVGSGAGFPSIPLAIAKNNWKITILDALQKRVQFLTNLIGKLNLDTVMAIHIRAEDYAKEKRESFDVVTARAVAKLNVLSELCLPLTKIGGLFLAMKGAISEEEMKDGTAAIERLGGKILKVKEFCLPEGLEHRQIIVVKKLKQTPLLYPRPYNKIKEKPIKCIN